ncbi:MAG: efflux RND transporter permease subunit, partial [Desulfocapsaceae bacterium]|nr:efflux RND transporter permease subunit [Desulfocapsaceae bacterium]
MNTQEPKQSGFAGRLAGAFINSKLTPLGIIASLLLGIMAIMMLPREEEPQIKVPMIDVMVSMEGATPREVEEQVTVPMEKLLYELPDVEYIYSTSMTGQSLLVVRFYVGADLETAIVRLNQKLATNYDRIPHRVSRPLVKPHTIDDVPILALTFHSRSYDHYTLRRLAAEVDDSIKNIPSVAETKLIGGTKRQVRIKIDPLLLTARNLSLNELVPLLQQANRQSFSGNLVSSNKEIQLQTGTFLTNSQEIGRIVVGVHGGKPVYLEEVADISDGEAEVSNYVLYGARNSGELETAVTLSIAKRPGANAVSVVDSVMQKVDNLKGTLIPADIEISVTRDYGETASEKSNELLLHMGIAVFGVAVLILVFLG